MSALRLLFNLYPGEVRRSKLFVLLGLLWSFGTYGMFTLSEGTFLEYVGADYLPGCYVAIALGLCLFSSLLLFLINRLPMRRFFGGIITLWSAIFFLFYGLHAFTDLSASPSYWFVFRVIGWIMPISSYICFWSFVDQYFDLQDGKRVFAFFNAFLLLGDFLAAGVISFVVEWVGISPLMLLFGTVTALALPMILIISRQVKPILDEDLDHLDSPPPLSMKKGFKVLIGSRFTLTLLLFYLVMQLLNIITEYNYMDGFERAFAGRHGHELTAFVGRCSMWISFGNMLVCSLIYGRLVKNMGVNNIILIGPSIFMALFSCWFWKQGLSIAIFGMISREGISYVMDDNNLNLLLSGVPSKIKNQIRITVESFFEPAGMLISAFLLFFFHQKSVMLGASVAAIAFVVVLVLRYHYPKAIFQNLIAHSIRFGKKAVDWIGKGERKEVEFRLLSHLKSSHEKSQLLAFEYLLKLKDRTHLRHLLNHINQFSLPGKIEAIELLGESCFAKEPLVVERLERLRRLLPYPQIRSVIHLYFARHGLFQPQRVMHDLHSDDIQLRCAAILTIKSHPFGHQLPTFCQLAEERLEEMLQGDETQLCAALLILGFEGRKSSIEQLFGYLSHSSFAVRRQAAKALSQVADPSDSSIGVKLASRLCYTHDLKTRSYCLDAIEKFANPDSLIPLLASSIHFRPEEIKRVESFALNHSKQLKFQLLALLKQSSYHERCRLLAGRILAKTHPRLLKEQINRLVQNELARAYDYFFHAKTVQRQVPQQDLSLLEDALMTGYHSVVDFVIQLIGAANEITECDVLTISLWSSNKKVRAHAIESLEKAAPPRLFAMLQPLINDDDEVKISNFLRQGGTPLCLTQLLDKMAVSASPTDRIISAGLKTRLNYAREKQEKTLEELVAL
ncbi:MAG: hypothetical protein S4CHLAM81_13510 [Chlamydiales bacterium]|nr:hypothetical protein [Chlamydiales bacterium]MCH9636123.1 hypothetical protein [Chlamydiales bacterium]MCH9703269.1 hypothetical protein [Chlamydiota bacterium]